ncbi:DUF2778 domain-containing protein [Hahella sp. KA22]|uniref:DUF2778 domain-containing protein n=1 Tax=Hahella sp. KA22 TaxID=1628392 RepID=UPI000FDE5959|nr:DUF2778 domain-containing protein [Hahella sp. KA22]AZZ94916.1 DUF2778 domain-containing protein [Hahella sp. KA22]QAY52560.1 DUF2778 domain-containing protein [Hahella sp. KA22]
MAELLLYDGKQLHWKDPGDGGAPESYKATSGMNHPSIGNFQSTAHVCIEEHGPVPPGIYTLKLWMDSSPASIDPKTCALQPSWKIQSIPRGAAAKTPYLDCEPYVANWGLHRVRFEPADSATKAACAPIFRGGFYLHDSVKGFSHGCIEVETRFFTRLKKYASKGFKESMKLKIAYAYTSTYGGTKALP